MAAGRAAKAAKINQKISLFYLPFTCYSLLSVSIETLV